MNNGFEYENQFNTDNAFTSIKFGYDRPILETELNEMQEIQNYNRRSLMHKICKSGIVELSDRDFTGEKIIYNPNMERNKIAIAPMRVNVNGYEAHICGDYEIDGMKTYLDIDLGNAPSGNDYSSLYRDDLVFLQVWFDEFTSDDQIKRYGDINGQPITNTLIDSRVGEETSHRLGLKWKIRVAEFIDFDRWEYGFGYENNGVNGYSPIKTDITSGINIMRASDDVFANATHFMFKGCSFYGDNNLWVAGRPNIEDPSNTKDSNLVFAIPLFRIIRRNKKLYSFDNPNGSIEYNEREVNLRPDGKCYDIIYESDVIDLRKNVIINNSEVNYYLDNTLDKLFTGKLNTKIAEKMRRIQFGIRPLTTDIQNIKFIDSFDPSNKPILGNKPLIEKRSDDVILDYVPSVTQWGLNVNGDIKLTYNVSQINSDEGTIDFFMSPKWNGFDNVDQTILGLYNAMSNPFLTIEKINNKLEIKRYADATATAHVSKMYVSLNELATNKIYHFRICWSVLNNVFECYVNGNFAGNSLDPYIIKSNYITAERLTIGKFEKLIDGSVDIRTGFTIDELSIYNKYLGDTNWQIPQDYIKGNALILPSFNGIFRNYRDNQYEQKNMVNYVSTLPNTATLSINAPYKTTFSNTTPKIYCLTTVAGTPGTVTEGTELVGTWVGLNTNKLTFVLQTTGIAGFTKFNGEKLAIVYGINLADGSFVDDVPLEVLKSEITNLKTNISQEVSFNIENNTGKINEPREVKTLINKTTNPDSSITYTGRRYIYDMHDSAYDFSTFRDKENNDFAFSRLLEYYTEGNGTNLYYINIKQYGYDVLYIRKAYIIRNIRNNDVKPINIISIKRQVSPNDPTQVVFAVELRQNIYNGDKIRFELALGGTTFDYNNNSKAFVGNICKSNFLEFTATGDKFEYTVPLSDITNMGLEENGVLLSLGKQYIYPLNFEGKEYDVESPDSKFIGFRNNIAFNYEYLDGIGKPYLKMRIFQTDSLGNQQKIPAGEKIQIPIFMTYQPISSDILSVWYNYIPYQGTLYNKEVKLKRLSDWKYFMTTLSSGNASDKYNNPYSLNNLINHLPGGATSSPSITGQNINLKNYGFDSFQEIDGYTLNQKLIFINENYIGTVNEDIDKYLFSLDTHYKVNKQFGKIQDDKILINDKDFKIYLPMNESPINKYCGMTCIVSNEFGDLYLFVVGDTNNNVPSVNNSISPEYGDLFIIPNRPNLINRN